MTHTPRYKHLAAHLLAKIEDGTFPVGSLLPTEKEICETENVSRFTAREALRLLTQSGLVERRRGIGTIVISTARPGVFSQTLSSIEDLLQYARDARLEILSLTKPGKPPKNSPFGDSQQVTEISGLRYAPDTEKPIARTTIHLDSAVAPPKRILESLNSAIIDWIEAHHPIAVAKIEQTIGATALTQRDAKLLDAGRAEPALELIRHYFDADGRLIIASQSIHPAGRFAYRQEIERSQNQI